MIAMRRKLVIPAVAVAIVATVGTVAVLSETSSGDTETCVSQTEVDQYQDGWSVDHVSEVFDVPGYVSFVGDESFRKRYIRCDPDYRQVVTFWNDTGLSHGTWQVFVG